MTGMAGSGADAGTGGRIGWLERHPLLAAGGASAAFLALAQATNLLLRNQEFLGPEMAAGLTKLSVVVSVVTVLLFLPIAALVRRFLPAWREGDRLGASWAVCFGFTAALVGWMIAVSLSSSPAVPRPLAPWIDALAALACCLAASALRLRYLWVRAWAVVTGILVLLVFVPYPRSPARTDGGKPRVEAAAKRPDVVLVSIDTLRADHLGPMADRRRSRRRWTASRGKEPCSHAGWPPLPGPRRAWPPSSRACPRIAMAPDYR